MNFWIFWGKAKQILSQLGIYFSGISMGGVMITMWHTTASPILESHGIVPSYWWLVGLLGVPLILLSIIEWRKGTEGYFQSFARMFYTTNSELRQDIELLKHDNAILKAMVEELLRNTK